jgi:uncharacterized protein YhfF
MKQTALSDFSLEKWAQSHERFLRAKLLFDGEFVVVWDFNGESTSIIPIANKIVPVSQ